MNLSLRATRRGRDLAHAGDGCRAVPALLAETALPARGDYECQTLGEDALLTLVHTEDQARVQVAYQRALAGPACEWNAACGNSVERRIWTELRSGHGGQSVIWLHAV